MTEKEQRREAVKAIFYSQALYSALSRSNLKIRNKLKQVTNTWKKLHEKEVVPILWQVYGENGKNDEYYASVTDLLSIMGDELSQCKVEDYPIIIAAIRAAKEGKLIKKEE